MNKEVKKQIKAHFRSQIHHAFRYENEARINIQNHKEGKVCSLPIETAEFNFEYYSHMRALLNNLIKSIK